MISNVFVTSLRMCLKSNLYVWMWPMAILNFSWSMWYVFYYCSFRKIHEIALKERNNHFFHCRKKYAKLFPLIRYSLGMSSPETWLRLWSLLELILLRFVFSFIFLPKFYSLLFSLFLKGWNRSGICLYHPKEDWSWISTAICCFGMCGQCPWIISSYYFGNYIFYKQVWLLLYILARIGKISNR